ncbi:hypothetical protein BDM02DRAFT_3112048 [Thelephora ganbajun]|uniref:Uncharacterized protein n=1 Tax=Thelephora ganbajun TaxID=370292 RepID=A0ACB6ZM83_THEGA|nr:hypothetical protein BDM02DRAFT_3112048 [Thelephora ganbajun]
MVLPRSIETHMIRRASRPGRDGWFYFPEFEAVVEEYTRLKRDPEALKAFIEARKLAVRENLEFRARRGKWLGAHDAKDRARKVRQKQREVEFLAVFREHLPEYSEQNPLLPPDEVVLREVEGLSEFLMEQGGVVPVTSERVRKISGLLVAHCEAFNRKIRRMMVVISKRIPMDQPFTMTDDECREYLGRATTIFIVAIERQQLWYTHQSFALTMRHIREKKVLFGMLDDFYVNEDYSEHIGALLEYMGLLRTATLDAALAKQEELKVVCQCKSTDFEQPASFIELARHIATDHPQRGGCERTETSMGAGTPSRYSLCVLGVF